MKNCTLFIASALLATATAEAQSSHTIVTETPVGVTRTYTRQGLAWASMSSGYTYLNYQKDNYLEIVFDADGETVWFKDIICFAKYDSYVKGTLVENGSKIQVDLDQYVGYIASEDLSLKLAMCDLSAAGDTYVPDYETEYVYYAVEGDKLTLLGAQDDYDEYSNALPTRIFGLIYDCPGSQYDQTWAYAGELQTVLTRVNADLVEVPADLQTADWSISYTNEETMQNTGRIVSVGFDDDKVYFQGLNSRAPEQWAMGYVEGDKVRIPNGQFMGQYNNYLIYLVNGTSTMITDPWYGTYLDFEFNDADFYFNYDAEAHSLVAVDPESALLINAGLDRPYYFEALYNPTLTLFEEVAARPADPSVLFFLDAVAEYGMGMFQCNVPLSDVTGKFLNANKVAYKYYILADGEILDFVLNPDEYANLTEEMTEIPYSFTDNKDIMAGGAQLYFYQTGFQAMGIQSINYAGGERHVSNIVWSDGTVTEVADEPTTGIQHLSAPVCEGSYDLMGRQTNGLDGIRILRKGDKNVKVLF